MNEILIYGDIGWDNTAKAVSEQLKGFDGEPVTVKISSGGGDVFEGVAILNALRGYAGEVTTVVESIAASAASFIAVGAGGKVIARPNAELMLHKSWTMLAGNADDVEKIKADLSRQDIKIAGVYAGKAGGELDDWLSVMSAETWYTAQEALDAGLIDEVQDAKQPVEASIGGRRVLAQFKYSNRAAAPPPPNASRSESAANTHIHPQGEERSDDMSLTKEDIVALIRDEVKSIRNEPVQISGEVEVTYPEDVKVAPTEKVTVEPIIGEDGGTTGLTFEIGTVAEGFTAEVDEAGVLSITAPAGVEPGDKAEFSVKVNDVEVPATAEVKAVSEESTEETTPEPTAEPIGDTVTLDRETYNEMQAAARFGWEAKDAADKQAREAEVDKWIAEGRVNPVRRAKIVDQMHADPEAARELYGKIPKNTIPLSEVGYSKQNKTVRDTADEKFDARAIAAARRKEGN